MVGDPYEDVGDGEDGHYVDEPSEEEEVGEGLEPALVHYVAVLDESEVFH